MKYRKNVPSSKFNNQNNNKQIHDENTNQPVSTSSSSSSSSSSNSSNSQPARTDSQDLANDNYSYYINNDNNNNNNNNNTNNKHSTRDYEMNDEREIKSLNVNAEANKSKSNNFNYANHAFSGSRSNQQQENVRLIKSPLFVRTHSSSNENNIENSSFLVSENSSKHKSSRKKAYNSGNLRPSTTVSNINALQRPDLVMVNQKLNAECVGEASKMALYANFTKSLSSTSNYIISDSSENVSSENVESSGKNGNKVGVFSFYFFTPVLFKMASK